MQKPKGVKLAAVIIGSIAALAILVFGGFLLVGRFTQAAGGEPQNVQVADITQNSAQITWTTGSEVEGIIEYGTSPTSLTLFGVEGEKATNHAVDLTLLSPDTTYYFQIKIGDKAFTNGGVPWSFTTTGETKTVEPTPAPTAAASESTILESVPASPSSQLCNETDCEKIKTKLGKGCSTQDYFLCVRKLSPTPTPTP